MAPEINLLVVEKPMVTPLTEEGGRAPDVETEFLTPSKGCPHAEGCGLDITSTYFTMDLRALDHLPMRTPINHPVPLDKGSTSQAFRGCSTTIQVSGYARCRKCSGISQAKDSTNQRMVCIHHRGSHFEWIDEANHKKKAACGMIHQSKIGLIIHSS